jgi:hypothetical protein
MMSISSVLGCPFGIELVGCFVFGFDDIDDAVLESAAIFRRALSWVELVGWLVDYFFSWL